MPNHKGGGEWGNGAAFGNHRSDGHCGGCDRLHAGQKVADYCPHLVWLNLSWPPITELPLHELGGSRFGVSSMERRCRPDMSNFCCLPGRAGGTPIGV